jgi:hypothetical protein
VLDISDFRHPREVGRLRPDASLGSDQGVHSFVPVPERLGDARHALDPVRDHEQARSAQHVRRSLRATVTSSHSMMRRSTSGTPRSLATFGFRQARLGSVPANEGRGSVDTAVLTALSAILGSLVGGSATIATAWLTQRTQGRREHVEAEIRKREGLYVEFITEGSKLLIEGFTQQLESRSGCTPSTPSSTGSASAARRKC